MVGKVSFKVTENRNSEMKRVDAPSSYEAVGSPHGKSMFQAFDDSVDGEWELDCATAELRGSDRWKQILGMPLDRLVIALDDWTSRIEPRDLERVRGEWKRNQDVESSYFESEIRCLHEDSTWSWVQIRLVRQVDEDGRLMKLTGVISDITARKMQDTLTGLQNRESLLNQLQRRIAKAKTEPRNFAVYFVDLDSFKRINESLGHDIGDALLVQVARRLEETVSLTKESIAARVGGDEFVVLVSDLATEADALTFAALLEHLLSAAFDCGGRPIHVSASIGVTFGSPQHRVGADRMLEEADIAMYQAKMQGKNRHVLFSSPMKAAAIRRLNTERDLRQALRDDQIRLFYQPKVELVSGRLVGLEALIRWRHPKLGSIAPEIFIPIAEETGLIHSLGDWVASESIRQLSSWIRDGVVAPSTTIAINLSASQFRGAALWRNLVANCRKECLPNANVVLEITESVFIQTPSKVTEVLAEGMSAGFGLDLDDFGTGYSSLSYLHHFPFRNVKIDRSFVGQMLLNKKSDSLVRSIIGLAHSLDMGVIAEGVESLEQSLRLQSYGCSVGQGFFFSKPVSACCFEASQRLSTDEICKREDTSDFPANKVIPSEC